jgi:3-dehydroquinate synthase
MTIDIKSQSHPYSVETMPDLTTALRTAGAPSAHCLVDDRVHSLYETSFSSIPTSQILSIRPSEEQKSYEQLLPVFGALLERGVRRNATLVVVGGGVVQDIGCFIASVLFRGVRWEYIPTTLLSQCDSCIGSKSSLNIGTFKNQLGTFYSPYRVLLAPTVLRTLRRDEILSGLGEAIKLHLLAGEEAFNSLRASLDALPADPSLLEPIILASLRIKKVFIEEDEFDHGRRNILNYDHTFGHAFESTTHYAISHGIAVSLGISAATAISARLGWVRAGYADDMDAFLRRFYEPFDACLDAVDSAALRAALMRDKKNTGTGLTCILTRGEGRMEKQVLSLDDVVRWLADWLRHVRHRDATA